MIFDEIRRRYHYGRYAVVKELINSPNNLLDIGCGRPCDHMEDGSFIKYLGYGKGMDIKKIEYPDFDFIQGDILDIPFQKNSFDTVVAMEVLEHLSPGDMDLALRNMARVLKEDGNFIVSTPNNGLLWRIVWPVWERTVGRMWKETHEVEFTTKEWSSVLSRYFKIVEIRTHWHVLTIFKMKKKKSKD